MKTGETVMDELPPQMGDKGSVAILAGNQNAPNLRKRVDGVKEAAAKYPGIKIVDTFYHIETPQDAAAEVIRAQNAYPQIQGWAMIGGWPLFTQTLLTDLDPKQGEDRRGRRAAGGARVRGEGAGAGAARAADLPVGLRVGAADRGQGAPQAGGARRSSRWSWCGSPRRTSAPGRAS